MFVIVVAAAASLAGGLHARTWWDQFTAPASAELTNGGSRLAEAGSNHRWVWWKEAWRGFEQHKLAGTGAGSFEFTNLRYRTTSVDITTEPHNLPVQFLSETGAVGLGLFLLATLALVFGARRRTDPEIALALILPAYLLHGLLDIDWDFAAVSGPVFLVAGALVARPLTKPRGSYSTGLVAAGVAVLALSSFFAVWLGNRWIGQAESLVVSNPRACGCAREARPLSPAALGRSAHLRPGARGRGAGTQSLRSRTRPAAQGDSAPAREQADLVRAWLFQPRGAPLPATALPEFEPVHGARPPGLRQRRVRDAR